MSQLSTTISKLAIESDDETVIGDVFVAKPKTELAEKLGIICGIIELRDQPDEFVDKFFEVISDLEAEYYLPPFENEGGNEKRFEEALQRANRRINKAMRDSLEVVNPKKINALLALNNKNKIYLSRIGKNQAFLFHKKKQHDYTIIDIFNSAGEKRSQVNTEKMFSNIINGSMTEKDNILFCSDNVLENLSQNDLKDILTDNDNNSAFKEIKKLLKSDGNNDKFYALVIDPIVSEEDEEYIEDIDEKEVVKKQPPKEQRGSTQNSINRLISTQEDTEKFLAPSMAPNWKKALIIITIGLRKGLILAYKYFKIFISQLINWITMGIAKIKKVIDAKYNKKSSNETANDKSDDDKQETDEEINEPKNNKYKTKLKEKNTVTIVDLPQGGNLLQIISNWLNQQIAKFIALNKSQRILLIIAFVLIFFFSQSMVWQGRASSVSDKVTVDDKISQIEEYLNTAEAQNIFNDEDGAKSSLSSAIALMSEIPNSRKYKDEKENLQNRIDGLEKDLQKIEYVENPTIISDLSNQNPNADIKSISKFENTIFAIDTQNQSLYKVDTQNKTTVSGKLTSNFNETKKIVAESNDEVLVLNNDNQIYRYNFANNEIVSVLTGEQILDFDLYGGKLYSLKSNQILKHFASDNGYNSGSSWIKNNESISDQISMAIDGGIYTIDNNNTLRYFLSGSPEPVNFSQLTTPLSAPKQMFSNIESDYLYILDQNNNRIVVLDKNSGNLKTQYTSKEFNNIKSMYIEENQKKIYLAADQKIYLIDITF